MSLYFNQTDKEGSPVIFASQMPDQTKKKAKKDINIENLELTWERKKTDEKDRTSDIAKIIFKGQIKGFFYRLYSILTYISCGLLSKRVYLNIRDDVIKIEKLFKKYNDTDDIKNFKPALKKDYIIKLKKLFNKIQLFHLSLKTAPPSFEEFTKLRFFSSFDCLKEDKTNWYYHIHVLDAKPKIQTIDQKKSNNFSNIEFLEESINKLIKEKDVNTNIWNEIDIDDIIKKAKKIKKLIKTYIDLKDLSDNLKIYLKEKMPFIYENEKIILNHQIATKEELNKKQIAIETKFSKLKKNINSKIETLKKNYEITTGNEYLQKKIDKINREISRKQTLLKNHKHLMELNDYLANFFKREQNEINQLSQKSSILCIIYNLHFITQKTLFIN